MNHENFKTVLYRQDEGSWVADIRAIRSCYALMGSRDAVLSELAKIFALNAEEYRLKGQALPADSTEIINA